MILWLILLVSAILGGGFGGYSADGKNTLYVSTRGANLGGDEVSCSSTLGAAEWCPMAGTMVVLAPYEMHAQWVHVE